MGAAAWGSTAGGAARAEEPGAPGAAEAAARVSEWAWVSALAWEWGPERATAWASGWESVSASATGTAGEWAR